MSCKVLHGIQAIAEHLSENLLILDPDYITIASEVSHIHHRSVGCRHLWVDSYLKYIRKLYRVLPGYKVHLTNWWPLEATWEGRHVRRCLAPLQEGVWLSGLELGGSLPPLELVSICQISQEHNSWTTKSQGRVMLFALWRFPQSKAHKDKRSSEDHSWGVYKPQI